METGLKNYIIVTSAYWAFTITDGALRMLVVLYFHLLGYSPFEVAMLFVFYELFGVVTNLVGGWLGARIGLNLTLNLGLALQIIALLALTVPNEMLTVVYVMAAQALSGIAKDLNKMSAKASIKTLIKKDDGSKLFRWVALLTGSKNALKGAGFFVGALLLEWLEFRGALHFMAVMLIIVLSFTVFMLPKGVGKMKSKPKFTQIFSNIAAINWLSASRFFLFGSRDVWFVVGLPVFLFEVLDWSTASVGAFMATWIIAYGIVQSSAPSLLKWIHRGQQPDAGIAKLWVFILILFPTVMALALQQGYDAESVIIVGLILFGIVFAINSSLHSYLILAYANEDKVSLNVGFYYMANAGGRLAGTVISGWAYQSSGIIACLWWSAAFVVLATLLSIKLPSINKLDVK